jgi:hypothetical protein
MDILDQPFSARVPQDPRVPREIMKKCIYILYINNIVFSHSCMYVLLIIKQLRSYLNEKVAAPV